MAWDKDKGEMLSGVNDCLTHSLTLHNLAKTAHSYNEDMKKLRERKNRRKVDARAPGERISEGGFFLCASVSVLAVVLISVFIFIKGLPAISQIGVFSFIFGSVWKPTAMQFGILPMIVTSLITALISVIIGSVIGILAACYMTDLAGKRGRRLLKPCIDLLAGIPSVVYGFFGLVVLVPLIRQCIGGNGLSMLAAVIILSIMILPTVISITMDAIQAVPHEYREGALALGATHMQTLFTVVLPAAKKTILAGVVLGMGRAIGETMAVMLVAGNRPTMPGSILDPVRTMTSNIAMEMSYASGLHQEALFATGVILFLFIMAINGLLRKLTKPKKEKAR